MAVFHCATMGEASCYQESQQNVDDLVSNHEVRTKSKKQNVFGMFKEVHKQTRGANASSNPVKRSTQYTECAKKG